MSFKLIVVAAMSTAALALAACSPEAPKAETPAVVVETPAAPAAEPMAAAPAADPMATAPVDPAAAPAPATTTTTTTTTEPAPH